MNIDTLSRLEYKTSYGVVIRSLANDLGREWENADEMMEDRIMESWRLVWRDGFVPVISTSGLEALREALKSDDPRLTQGSTTTPPPLMCVQDWPVEAA